eukprot:15872690-Heterocapsa_arctica.AAC.1
MPNLGTACLFIGDAQWTQSLAHRDPCFQPTSIILRNNYRRVSLVVKDALSEQLCSFSVDSGSIPVLSILYI